MKMCVFLKSKIILRDDQKSVSWMPSLHTNISRTHVIRINGGETYRVLRLIGALIFTNKIVTNACGRA